MTITEIISKLEEFYEIASGLPSTDVCEVAEIANDLSYEIDRLIGTLEENEDKLIEQKFGK